MAEVNKNGRITLNKPLSVSNVVNYPLIGNSEHIMGDLKTCKITMSLEDGRNLKKIVKEEIKENDIILTMGAGSITQLGKIIADKSQL